jgi:EmrB/QacA subfamily drug resistance transporter
MVQRFRDDRPGKVRTLHAENSIRDALEADAPAATGGASEPALYAKRWWALAVLSLGLLLTSLDAAILTVAVPSLTRGLRASFSTVQWFLDAYLIVFASLQLGTGVIGDRLGRRGIFVIGMIIFALGSFGAAMSTSSGQLIAMRAIMGLGAALVMPTTLSIVIHIFPPKEHPLAIAVWSGVAAIGIPLGPVLGGWLLSHFWWGSIFLINLPLIAVGLIGTYLFVPTSKDPVEHGFDWTGLGLSIVGLAALTYGIIEAPNNGWLSPPTILALGGGVGVLGLFVRHEQHSKDPALDIRLLRNPNLSAAAITIALAMFAMYFVGYFFNQYLQFTLGLSPFQSGLRMLPTALGLLLGSPLSIPLAKRFGARTSVAMGLALMEVGLLLMTKFDPNTASGLPMLVTGVIGFGIGLAATPATTLVMESVPPSETGVASGLNTIAREIGGALGIATLGTLLTMIYRQHVLASPTVSSLPGRLRTPVASSVGSALEAARSLPVGVAHAVDRVANEAFVHSVHVTVVVASVVLVSGIAVAVAFLPGADADEGPSDVTAGDKAPDAAADSAELSVSLPVSR